MPYPAIYPFGYQIDGVSIINLALTYKKLCSPGIPSSGYGFSLFPGDDQPPSDRLLYGTSVSGAVKLTKDWSSNGTKDFFSGYLVVCVTYISGIADRPHRTAVLYSLQKATETSNVLMLQQGSFAD